MSPLLSIEHVTKTFARGGVFARTEFAAVDDVSFSLESATPEIFAIIGESGSGKTTLARMILSLQSPSAGSIHFLGTDISKLRSRRDRLQFMQKVQPIFQSPSEAFNPLKPVDRYLFASAHHFAGHRNRDGREAAADEALKKVGLSLTEVKGRYPHELSGGQLQRTAIARALIPSPALIVADEPVSMVDASLRMSIVNLFKTLRDQLRVSIIYITHDLATAYYISDRVLILQKGKVVETGPARQVLSEPRHPYTIRLRESILSLDDADRIAKNGATLSQG
jgi:ABC-type oligopeptide transport system ATPase subunit